MNEAVIVAATRTAVGKAIKGTLADTRPDDMAATIVRGLLERAGDLDPRLVDDVILGCAFPEGEQGMNFARQVVFLAGLPDETSAMSINRFCSSGLESIHLAALKVMRTVNLIELARFYNVYAYLRIEQRDIGYAPGRYKDHAPEYKAPLHRIGRQPHP